MSKESTKIKVNIIPHAHTLFFVFLNVDPHCWLNGAMLQMLPIIPGHSSVKIVINVPVSEIDVIDKNKIS